MYQYRFNEFAGFSPVEKRLFQWLREYEVVTIAAWRDKIENQHPECQLYYPEKWAETGQILTRSQRDHASEVLIWMLERNLQYGVIQVQGGFPGQTYLDYGFGDVGDICEFSYVVFNLPHENGKIDSNFKENMKKIAAYFNQDSIGYLAPEDKYFYLLYTNDKYEFGTEKFMGKLGKKDHIGLKINKYFSKIKLHPFEESDLPLLTVGNFYTHFVWNTGYFFLRKAGVSYNMSRDVRAWKTLLSLGISDCRFWNRRERYKSEVIQDVEVNLTDDQAVFQIIQPFHRR
jgi:hypothetical protein